MQVTEFSYVWISLELFYTFLGPITRLVGKWKWVQRTERCISTLFGQCTGDKPEPNLRQEIVEKTKYLQKELSATMVHYHAACLTLLSGCLLALI